MVLDKKGSSYFVAFMLGVLCFVLGMALAYPTQQVVNESMLNMNCTTNYLTNSSISNQDRAICTQMDFMISLFVGLLFGLAGLLIGRFAV